MNNKTKLMRVHNDLKETLINASNLDNMTLIKRSKILVDFAKAKGFPNMVEVTSLKKRKRRVDSIVFK